MPMTWTEPELYLEHGGVTVHRIYRDDCIDSGCLVYWYGWSVRSTPDDKCFDVRDLPNPNSFGMSSDTGCRAVMRLAIDNGILTDNGINEHVLQQRQYGAEQFQDGPAFLNAWPEDDDSRIVRRRVRPDIGEIQVQCDQSSTFVTAHFSQLAIWSADHTLLVDRFGFVAGSAQKHGRGYGQVLVNLELHPPTPGFNVTTRSRANSAA